MAKAAATSSPTASTATRRSPSTRIRGGIRERQRQDVRRLVLLARPRHLRAARQRRDLGQRAVGSARALSRPTSSAAARRPRSTTSHQLYVDGLKLSPPSPTMLDLRDAMLQADACSAERGCRRERRTTAGSGRPSRCAAWARRRSTPTTRADASVVEDFIDAPACPAPARSRDRHHHGHRQQPLPKRASIPARSRVTRSGDTARAAHGLPRARRESAASGRGLRSHCRRPSPFAEGAASVDGARSPPSTMRSSNRIETVSLSLTTASATAGLARERDRHAHERRRGPRPGRVGADRASGSGSRTSQSRSTRRRRTRAPARRPRRSRAITSRPMGRSMWLTQSSAVASFRRSPWVRRVRRL